MNQPPQVDQLARPAITQAEAAAALQRAAGIAEVPAGASASDVYRALTAQRRELRSQLRTLEGKRSELTSSIRRDTEGKVNVAGLEARVVELDARIAALDAQLAQADMAVARASAIPGAIVEPRREGPPEAVYPLAALFILVAFLPLSVAFARRIWRRSAVVVTSVPGELREQVANLTQSVEAIGLEVERIGEGQRFVTRVLSESREGARAVSPGVDR